MNLDPERFEELSDEETQALYRHCAAVGGLILDQIQHCFMSPDGTVDPAGVITTLHMIWARYAAAVTDESAEQHWNNGLETTKELFISEFNKARGFIAAAASEGSEGN